MAPLRTLWDEDERAASHAPRPPEAVPAIGVAGQGAPPPLRLRTLWGGEDEQPAPARPAPAAPAADEGAPKNKGGRPKAAKALGSQPGAAAPVWRYHHLTVTGPETELRAFEDAARGPGVVPWRIDGDALEEDLFNLAASQPVATRTLSIEGCRILARQFRSRAEARNARAAALSHYGRGCPLDLHRLLPVPDEVLRLGPSHPKALAWLRRSWGVTDLPRRVEQLSRATAGRRLPAGHRVLGYAFFAAADEAPRVAVGQLAARWPGLGFALRPRQLL